jgi:hypothetical protein
MEERNDERQDAMNGKTIVDPDRPPAKLDWPGGPRRPIRHL